MSHCDLPRSFIIVLFSLILFVGTAVPAQDGTVLVLTDGLDQATLSKSLRPSGARLLVFVPELGAAIVRVPERGRDALLRRSRLRAFSRLEEDGAVLEGAAELPPLVQEWARARALLPEGSATELPLEPLHSDTLVGPDWWDDLDGAYRKDAPAGLRPAGADWQNTSEYLAGRISLNLLLLESNGYVDRSSEDWNETLEARVLAESMEAATDLDAMYPGAGLSFTVHLYSGRSDPRLETNYEPITRAADPSGSNGEDRWAKEVLAKLGYREGSRLTRSRLFADQTRMDDGSDWAINVFVVNSDQDADGRFADGRFAYAWIGGPHLVMTTDNSNWGLSRFNWVLRHEIHHSFFGLDQYASSECSCGAATGYSAGTNENCENGCGTVTPDVMINNSPHASDATRRQVGTFDLDLDGTPDLLAVPPEVTLNLVSGDLSCDGLVTLEGDATVLAPVNVNPSFVTPRRNITLHRLNRVEVRVNGGGWQSGLCFPRDGQYDSQHEVFDLSLSLSTGRHQIEVRSIDSRGNHSVPASRSVDIAESGQPLGASLHMMLTDSGPTLTWDQAPGAQTYRIRLSTHSDQVDDTAPYAEVASTNWSDSNPGTVFYRVVAVDGCGRETP